MIYTQKRLIPLSLTTKSPSSKIAGKKLRSYVTVYSNIYTRIEKVPPT